MNCIPMTEAAIRSFREGMELCFRRAIEEGLGISIVPHLDDGGKWVIAVFIFHTSVSGGVRESKLIWLIWPLVI